ncbi:recombinase family protein [Halobacillus kuroshimensis]|uniref:Recombinase family protein n=1 Tax=Halobacillus kuroshimensis TaxID=302481 RepID=A0ABS3DTR1_9BACI|nr:recombinase family protein [Halobacillus kuroshimensis]MBN8234725.1 recombinase family protein [Halobacillus kuroshimensis]
MGAIKNVAIYSRKSRPDETDEGIKRQLAYLIDKCIESGWEYEVFQEVGSSQDINRPELNKMLERVQHFHFDAVVVTDQDRLSRTTSGFSQIKDILNDYGVKVVTSSKIYDYATQEDDLMSDMQSIVAKQEYLNIKKRLVRGKRQSAKEGNWVGGKTPVGYLYDKNTKKLKPDEYAPTIKKIFTMYLDGKTSTEIAREFELEGVLTPTGSKWDKARIAVVLSNPVYKGTVIYGKTKVSKTSKKPSGTPRQVKTDRDEQIVYDNAHQPIVSPEDWDKVERIRKDRNSRPPSARIGKLAYTGLIKCGLCGRTHSFQRRKGKELRITSCQTRHYSEDGESYTVCQNKGCRLDNFEKLFFVKLSQFTDMLENHIEFIKEQNEQETHNPVDEKASLEAQLNKIEASIKRVQNGFVMEIFTEEEAHTKIKQFKAQKDNVEAQLEELNTKSQDEQIDELEETLRGLRGIMSGEMTSEPKRVHEILSRVIDHIEYKRVGDHKAEIDMKVHLKGQSEEQVQ